MGTRWGRFSRGWMVAGFSLFVAALSHTLGGGAVPSALAVVVSLAFAGVICIGLSPRTLSLWRMSVSVVASQLVFHGLFSLGGTNGALATDAAGAGAHDHGSLADLAVSGSALVAGAPTSAAHAIGAHAAGHGAAMWVAHSLAAMLTVLALRRGEAAFWGLVLLASMVIRAVFTPAAGAATRPRSPQNVSSTARVSTPCDLGVLLSPMRHRGPPAVSPAI